MKFSKKKIFALALAVCLVAILSVGTVAWFTAEDEVSNNFLVGDSTVLPDEIFGVDVWEEVDADGDGKVEKVGYRDLGENTASFGMVLPGQVIAKAPVLENTGKHSQFARAIVTVSNGDTLVGAVEGDWGDAGNFLLGTSADWTLDQMLLTKDYQLVYIYYYNKILDPGAVTAPVFESVAIPGGLTLQQAQAIENFQVAIVGQVIQSDHLTDPENAGETVTEPKTAFQLYFDGEGTVAGILQGDILSRDS